MKLMDGKEVAAKIKAEVKAGVAVLSKKPRLDVILVGEDSASKVYVGMKVKACKELGIKSVMHSLSKDTSEKELLDLIDKLNKDDDVNGILVQMPVPKQISRNNVVLAVAPIKDVDGFHPENVGKLVLKEPCLKACTPRGIMKLFQYYDIKLEGKEVVIIGRSIIVGTPVSQMCANENATIIICHSKTRDLAYHTRNADVIISAAGVRNLVTADMVKEGVVVVDVGMNRKDDGKLCGDVDFDAVKEKASYITPVPGGVGPMTIACLMANTLLAYQMQNEKKQ